MCLALVDSSRQIPRSSGVGWKVFRERRSRLYPELEGHGHYDIGAWYVAYDLKEAINTPTYLLGFHVFTKVADALIWNDLPNCVVRKVRWRHRLAIGWQIWRRKNRSVVVAKEILILPIAESKAKLADA